MPTADAACCLLVLLPLVPAAYCLVPARLPPPAPLPFLPLLRLLMSLLRCL